MSADGRHGESTHLDSPVTDRYAALETEDGDLLVFDAERDDAWIQSSSSRWISDLQ